jgi:hypothetical protein
MTNKSVVHDYSKGFSFNSNYILFEISTYLKGLSNVCLGAI